MQYSTNYNMNKPELAEQYRLSHWNENTDIIDTELKRNADNISDESTRASNAESALRNITDSTFKTALLNFCYPIGSLYWSSQSTDPAQLFGGTWTQIKDRFIWAKGNSDTVNATGGAKTVTLTTNQMPSHTHTFSGTEHSHTFTPSGTVSSHNHSINIDISVSGSTNKAGEWDFTARKRTTGGNVIYSGTNTTSTDIGVQNDSCDNSGTDVQGNKISYDGHTHTVTASGTVSGNTGNTQPTFTGTQQTIKATQGGTNANTGGGQAHENMPPYIVKYCWERTA